MSVDVKLKGGGGRGQDWMFPPEVEFFTLGTVAGVKDPFIGSNMKLCLKFSCVNKNKNEAPDPGVKSPA